MEYVGHEAMSNVEGQRSIKSIIRISTMILWDLGNCLDLAFACLPQAGILTFELKGVSNVG